MSGRSRLPTEGLSNLHSRKNATCFRANSKCSLPQGERCQASARKTRLLEDIAKREEQLSRLAIRMLMVEENETAAHQPRAS